MEKRMCPGRERSMQETAKQEEKETENHNYFQWLPEELVEKILDFVGGTENRNLNWSLVRSVCQQFNRIVYPKIRFGGRLTPETIDRLAQLKSDVEFKILLICNLGDNRIVKFGRPRGSRLNEFGGKDYDARMFTRSVEHLVIGGEAGSILSKKHYIPQESLPFSLSTGYTESQQRLVTVVKSVKGQDLLLLLEQIRDVKTLTITSASFLSLSNKEIGAMLRSSWFENVTVLDICIGRRMDSRKLGIFLLKGRFPSLRSFYARVYPLCFHLSVLANIYIFVSRHSHIENFSLSQSQALYGLPPLDTNPTVHIRNTPEMVENLQKVNLTCLRMDSFTCRHPVGIEWKRLELEFIKTQTNLRCLELSLHMGSSSSPLEAVLPNCWSTLERLELSVSNLTQSFFDCSILSSFKKLDECHLSFPTNIDFIRGDGFVPKLVNIDRLPISITYLHLGTLPTLIEIPQLRALKILNRILYSLPDAVINITIPSSTLVKIILEHLSLPSLVEIRMIQYVCHEVANFFNNLDHVAACIEDNESLVVFVDRERFSVSSVSSRLHEIPYCTSCSNHRL